MEVPTQGVTFAAAPSPIKSRLRNIRDLKLSAIESPSRRMSQSAAHETKSNRELQAYENEKGENYRILKKLGSGRQGTVMQLEKDSRFYAGKTIFQKEDDEKIMNFEKEFNILKELQHPNIPKVVELLENPKDGSKCLIMEYFDGITLKKYLEQTVLDNSLEEIIELDLRAPSRRVVKTERNFPACQSVSDSRESSENSPSPEKKIRHSSLNDRLKIFKRILETIEFIHSKRICHRDLNLENILVNEKDLSIRVIDFGLAKNYVQHKQNNTTLIKSLFHPHEAMFSPIGFMDFRAPEVLCGDAYSEKIDIWTCGLIFLRMFGSDSKVNSKKVMKRFEWKDENEQPNPAGVFEIAKTLEPLQVLLRNMLQTEPRLRICASESLKILKEFLKEI
jgi:serine/threonine protein kinase